jgi:hypothetical protein
MAINGAANYSKTSDEMLCKTCKFGQVVESSQGGTAVICHYKPDTSESSTPQRLNMLVTKCNRFELPQLLRLWDTAMSLHIEDGHCWNSDQSYIAAIGHVHQRVDTMGKRLRIFKEYPGREWDGERGHFTDEKPVVGYRVARWWRKLQG